jgi:hypothetical protein
MKTWTDEKGHEIPYSRITKLEKRTQRETKKLLRKAQSINTKLVDFKTEVAIIAEELWISTIQEAGSKTKDSKGNITIYNFDRSIKMEVNVATPIKFDDALIAVAREKFNEFLDVSTANVEDFMKEMIHSAFETSRGQLDTKQVMDLVSLRKRVDRARFPLFHEAIDLIEDSIRRPSSKKYFRIWYKDEANEYQIVDLNFSSI